MTFTRFASAAVIASILITALPTFARADEVTTGQAPAVNFRAAIDRAVTPTSAEPSAAAATLAKSRPALNARQNAAGGGGGGKGKLIWGLVGTAASLGTTYYVMKQVKKQTDQIAKQQQ